MNIIVTITYRNFYRRKTEDVSIDLRLYKQVGEETARKIYARLVDIVRRQNADQVESIAFIIPEVAETRIKTERIQVGDTITFTEGDINKTLDFMAAIAIAKPE